MAINATFIVRKICSSWIIIPNSPPVTSFNEKLRPQTYNNAGQWRSDSCPAFLAKIAEGGRKTWRIGYISAVCGPNFANFGCPVMDFSHFYVFVCPYSLSFRWYSRFSRDIVVKLLINNILAIGDDQIRWLPEKNNQGRIQEFSLGDHITSAKRVPIMGIWGVCLPAESRDQGRSPQRLKGFIALRHANNW